MLRNNPTRLRYLRESLKFFTLIKKNIYLDRKRKNPKSDDMESCFCKPRADDYKSTFIYLEAPNTQMFPTTVTELNAWTGWFQPNAMMIRVIVVISAEIENFKDISMPVSTPIQLVERVGVCVLENSSKEINLSCSISDKYFQQNHKLEKQELNNIANPPAPIWWKPQKDKLSIQLTRGTWQGLSIILVSPTASPRNGMF